MGGQTVGQVGGLPLQDAVAYTEQDYPPCHPEGSQSYPEKT